MTDNKKYHNQKGASIVEILIAILLFGIVLASIILGFTNIARNEQNARVRGQAINLTREGLEAIYSIAEFSWSDISNAAIGDPHHVITTAGHWELATGTETIDQYQRTITFENAIRNTSDNNLDTDGSLDADDYEDTGTKIITVTIDWNSFGKTFDYSQSTVLSNWKDV